MNAKRAKPIVAVDPRDEPDPFVGGYPDGLLESEGVFLAACLNEPAKFGELSQLLRPEHLYADANRRVYEALLAVYDASLNDEGKPLYPFDVVLLANWMRDHGTLRQVGGSPYLATLCDAQPATLNPGQHAAAIREAWKRRELYRVMARCATLLKNQEASHEDCYLELREHFREMKND